MMDLAPGTPWEDQLEFAHHLAAALAEYLADFDDDHSEADVEEMRAIAARVAEELGLDLVSIQ